MLSRDPNTDEGGPVAPDPSALTPDEYPAAYLGSRPAERYPTDDAVDRFGREILAALDAVGVVPGEHFMVTPEERPS